MTSMTTRCKVTLILVAFFMFLFHEVANLHFLLVDFVLLIAVFRSEMKFLFLGVSRLKYNQVKYG